MTLTQTAILTKQVIVISAISLVLLIAGFTGYNIWRAYYIAHLPPVEEKPDLKFGPLPAPQFPESAVSSSNFSYSLDTVTGGLPKPGADAGFEKIVKVYFITQTFATLLSPDKSSALAEKFGITALPQILSETKYQYREGEKNLLVDLDTGNFSYYKEGSEAASSAQSIDDDSKLISDFKQILGGMGILKNDLQNARVKVKKDESGKVLISLWPTPIEKRPVFTADFNKSLISSNVKGSAGNIDNYLSLDYTYYQVDPSTYATYYLKPPQEAFDDLKKGKGVILIEPDSPQVSITSVEIGYYMPQDYSPYLLPIYIFEGPSFAAYVSAIRTSEASPN